MPDHVANRDEIVKVLIRELFGPDPEGEELDTSTEPKFDKAEEAYGPFYEKGTGEEILQRDPPTKRYGVGVLYPFGTQDEEKADGPDMIGLVTVEDEEASPSVRDTEKDQLSKNTDKVLDVIAGATGDTNPSDIDLSLTNAYQPSSIGVSFLAEFSETSKLVVHASGGRYRKLLVQVGGSKRIWWVRSPVTIQAEFNTQNILSGRQVNIVPDKIFSSNTEGLNLKVEVFSRQYSDNQNQKLMTVCLVNRTEENSVENTLFQAHMKVTVITDDNQGGILPYPRPPFENLDEEEKSLELLYRKALTFAVGHGCAAGWNKEVTDQRVSYVTAESLPVFETPSTTPDVRDDKGEPIRVPMAPLAGLIPDNDGFDSLVRVVTSYESWIAEKQKGIPELDIRYRETAQRHIEACMRCADRMKAGIQYLRSNPVALRAFQLANRAILLQQIQSRSEPRKLIYEEKEKRITFSEEFVKPDPLRTNSNRGFWRAFQIAFLLMTIESTANPASEDRDNVELIWFPTGGGKTEAYLGLAAFALFSRRLQDPNDEGVHVLMRYTLRLLTAQQFQRAARLICAMEYIRRNDGKDLGDKAFSIGMWVGGSNTPNTRTQAVAILNGLSRGDSQTQNMFVIDRCPWCGAQMGPIDDELLKKNKTLPRVHGYVRSANTIIFKCPDHRCAFKDGLPIFVIDEDIYEQPPSMIIGTVDKFAMLSWRPEARSLFGIGKDGTRKKTPPGLIIQDELHLISGPLGSMVGLYETVIEELCTDRRSQTAIRPKIISSTATIRSYKEQIKGLYARNCVTLFPPPGLEDGDSFFARHARNKDGSLAPGRMYVGVYAPSLGSVQTVQVRTFTALLQAPMFLPEAERDPWWTLLLFFNSLRELGTTLSLLQSDIPDYQQAFMKRISKARKAWRSYTEIKELTGRAASEDIPKAISALERHYPAENPRPVDVCLASNILEVGVDIDRLSLMSVVGQPKTTSQYIQVTGRVGRSWWERPGLVVTIYSVSKPRDRSHFEKFRSYHQQLYSQVEPTSVTPFSPPALDRALHAIMASYVIQTGNEAATQSPHPYPAELIGELKAILLPRVHVVDPLELENFEKVFNNKSKEWQTWQPVKWVASYEDADPPLLRVAGAYVVPEHEKQSWPTMQSMRTVDAECVAEIMKPINLEGETENAC